MGQHCAPLERAAAGRGGDPDLLLVFYPLVMMAMVSLKTNLELTTAPFGLPREFQWQNYADAFWGMDYPTAFRNSAVLTTISAAGCTLLAAVGAYAIVRVTHGRKLFVFFNAFFLLGLALPQQVAMVPMVLWLQKLGLGQPFGVPGVHCRKRRVRRVFFQRLCGHRAPYPGGGGHDRRRLPFTAFRRIVFAAQAPMVTLLIIMILRVWNDFYVPADPFAGQDFSHPAAHDLPVQGRLFDPMERDVCRHDPGDPAADDRVFHLSKTDHFRNAERIGKTIGASCGTTMTE